MERESPQIVLKISREPLLKWVGKTPILFSPTVTSKKRSKVRSEPLSSNQGQICLCGSRIYVEKPIYEKFRDALVQKTKSLIQGDPTQEDTQQGAIVSQGHYEKILACLKKAQAEGGKFLTGGGPAQVDGDLKGGYFIQPTLIEGVGSESETNQEEIFGPVATITSFETEEEVIDSANSTRYGLSGSIWSEDLEKANRVAMKIDSGILWINTWMLRDLRTPFGGMKESGRGREGGQHALKFFSETKNICIG